MKESLISMFLLPSSILINKEEKLNKLDGNSYSFLENESNGLFFRNEEPPVVKWSSNEILSFIM